MSGEDHLRLENFIFIGRTFDEYMRMFDLQVEDLVNKRILDCPAGACSFTAHASAQGHQVTAADILYHLSGPLLEQKGKADLDKLRLGMASAKDDYVWDEFGDVDGQVRVRETALKDFIRDYEANPNRNRYVPATLPDLPFADNQFDLVLSAHFLFCYAEHIGFDVHLQTIRELLRVTTNEVRIFPLISNGGLIYPFLSDLDAELRQLGHEMEIVPVSYHFQRGANEMLRIQKEARK